MDEQDYYNRHKDEWNKDEAPYQPLAPDLAGESLLSSWRNTEAMPTRSAGNEEVSAAQTNLREQTVRSAAPLPTEESPATGQEAHTTPLYWGEGNIREVNEIMGGKPAAGQTTYGRLGQALQRYARGLRDYISQTASDVFSRSRGGS